MLVLVDTLHELLPAAHLLGVPINGPMDGPRFQGEPGQAYRHCRKNKDKEASRASLDGRQASPQAGLASGFYDDGRVFS